MAAGCVSSPALFAFRAALRARSLGGLTLRGLTGRRAEGGAERSAGFGSYRLHPISSAMIGS